MMLENNHPKSNREATARSLNKIERAEDSIRDALAGAQAPVLLLTGGKDSLALLNLCKPYRDRIHVVWSRTSMAFPHMVDFVRQATQGWRYSELVSDQEAYFARKGVPFPVVPMSLVPVAGGVPTIHANPGRCCLDLQYRPLQRFLLGMQADLLIHGQKIEDRKKGIWPIRRIIRPPCADIAPLSDWRNDDVLGYCLASGITLPAQYQSGVTDSLECWNCPIKADKRRFDWMTKHTPDLAARLAVLLSVFSSAVVDAYGSHVAPVVTAADQFLLSIAQAERP